MKTKICIKENSLRAKIAAKFLKTDNVALVVNNKIFLYNVSKTSFLSKKSWVIHELIHVQQYKKLGTIKFLILYLIQLIKNGYSNNLFEIEARENENNFELLNGYDIQ